MKIVKQSVEIMPVLSHLEQIAEAGKVCYQVEGVKGGPEAFVKRMIRNGHWSTLEMAVISVGMKFTASASAALFSDIRNDYMKVTRPHERFMVVTASVRAWMEWVSDNIGFYRNIVAPVAAELKLGTGIDIFNDKDCLADIPAVTSIYEGIGVLSIDDITASHPGHRDVHLHVMARFMTNRAVSHEIVRHRPCAILQESQRYCRYSSGRFGNEVTFICPGTFWKEDSPEYAMWERHCFSSEQLYLKLLKDGSSPQAARTVLPNSTKTELVLYANIKQWKHIFKLRADNKEAEPSMREIMIPLQEQFKKRGLI